MTPRLANTQAETVGKPHPGTGKQALLSESRLDQAAKEGPKDRDGACERPPELVTKRTQGGRRAGERSAALPGALQR